MAFLCSAISEGPHPHSAEGHWKSWAPPGRVSKLNLEVKEHQLFHRGTTDPSLCWEQISGRALALGLCTGACSSLWEQSHSKPQVWAQQQTPGALRHLRVKSLREWIRGYLKIVRWGPDKESQNHWAWERPPGASSPTWDWPHPSQITATFGA